MSHACHYCRHAGKSRNFFVEDASRKNHLGGSYDHEIIWKLGIDNRHMKATYPTAKKELALVRSCHRGDPHFGFQIGGHYKYMYFEACGDGPDTCLEWTIPEGVDYPALELHICDFSQLEEFVEFWREELEDRGWISPRERETDRAPKVEIKQLPIRNIVVKKEKK